jgi:hypothetical protein
MAALAAHSDGDLAHPPKPKPGSTIHILPDQILRTGLRGVLEREDNYQLPGKNAIQSPAVRLAGHHPLSEHDGRPLCRAALQHQPPIADVIANLAGLGSEVSLEFLSS